MAVCSEDLPAYGEDACAPLLQADSDAFAFVKKGQTSITSWDNATEWGTAIAANDVSVVKNVMVSATEPSIRTITNPRVQGPENIHTGWDYVIEFEDATISDANTAFYAALNQSSGNIVWRLYEEGQILLAEHDFYFSVTPIYGIDGEVLKYKGTAQAKIGPSDTIERYDEPAGIFDI